jgi:small subunit ribosomal protein S16
MVRIRLRRVGSKGQPSYRIVIANKEAARNGAFIENVGFYNPRTNPTTLSFSEDRIYYWMSKGAQPSDSVAMLFKSAGVDVRYDRFKKGEAMETLMADAAQTMGGKFAPANQSGLKTRVD